MAAEAQVAPGLVHHHFDSKRELLSALLQDLVGRFRQRIRDHESGSSSEAPLASYVQAALKLDHRADVTAARCWVGLLAEAIRDPTLFKQVRRMIDTEIGTIEKRSGHRLGAHDASAVLAFIIGALVLGAFAPQKTSGFAAPALLRFVASLER